MFFICHIHLIKTVTPIWFLLLLGAAFNFAGYFMIWLVVAGKITKPKIWQMCIYICIGANSQNSANTGALVTSVKNFPESRGSMIGLLKGYTGLIGAIMIQIYLAVYGNDSKSLILLIAWLPAAISILFVYTIRDVKPINTPMSLNVFYHFLTISIVLAVFLMALNLLEKIITFSEGGYIASATLVSFLVVLPLVISIREELLIWNVKKQAIDPPTGITVERPKPKAVSPKQGDEKSSLDAIFYSGNEGSYKERSKKVSVKDLTCIGTHCYRLPFIVLASVTFFGALSSLILVIRTRNFYSSDICKKFKENTEN
ncbi:hypothetical protein GOBAR_DD13668 [Gossypium barbadense]|nr:hypothetical protein GOBAR_DD13668 [Gossypium barbadense]